MSRSAVSQNPKIILGIDPGSLFTGFGVLRSFENKVEIVTCGIISPPGQLRFNERLLIVADELRALFEKVRPNATVVERVFLGKNVDSAFKLGHVRGLAIAEALRVQSHVAEYAARSVKKGVTGNGGASKEQVQTTLFAALGVRGPAKADISDALALAYYHHLHGEVGEAFALSEQRAKEREVIRARRPEPEPEP